MRLRRILLLFGAQNWFSVVVELVVVIVGVFLGIQVANWNDARLDAARKQQIIGALIADIGDSIGVQRRMMEQIDAGLNAWELSYARGEAPAPFVFRINGSDTAPDTWGMLQQTQLVDLFDPNTLFDLSFYYSELQGVGRKYIRYVIFVEEYVLPYVDDQTAMFYEDGNSNLKPVYRANMDRLRDYRDESARLMAWAQCLVFRLRSDTVFDTTCLRADFVLDGMQGA